ncbi:hypothetical protein ABFT23_14360 [Nocardioides sp. C4-1]|uniref:hypothetical protein n=1 Tax=Nocardioides sp. C4-1 TaxID=3151851 RepID=UPI0032674E3E
MSTTPTAREAVTPDRHDVRVRHQARDAAILMTSSLLMALLVAGGFLLVTVLVPVLSGLGR